MGFLDSLKRFFGGNEKNDEQAQAEQAQEQTGDGQDLSEQPAPEEQPTEPAEENREGAQ